MRALSVIPGRPDSAAVTEVDAPSFAEGSVLIRGRAVGICGTDIEIIREGYGQPPPGEERLILGHESLGEVVEAPPGSGLTPGQSVVSIVRRPDPEPCDYCGRGEWDMCANGRYTEHGIKELHGFASELYRVDPEFVVPVERSLGDLGVLVEPTSVVAKAEHQALHILRRSGVAVRTVLITGAGPIGLLAALVARLYGVETHVVDIVETGPKPDLVRDLGAIYHAGSARDLSIRPEVVIEATGIGQVVADALLCAAPGAVIALTGISSAPSMRETDLTAVNRGFVLSNKVMFGSVNASRKHYELAAEALSRADPAWLQRLITRRVPLDHWEEALERRPDDVKVVLEIGAVAPSPNGDRALKAMTEP